MMPEPSGSHAGIKSWPALNVSWRGESVLNGPPGV